MLLAIMLEFVSRAIIPGYQRAIINYDRQLIWKFVPNSKIYPEFLINQLGFRDSNHPLKNENNSTRILFIGDSYTAGPAVSESNIFPRCLETKLNQDKTKTYEIFNFGVFAYATDQEYILLKNIGMLYNPNIVILTVVPNDIRETYGKKLFYLENEKLKLDASDKAFNLNLKDRFFWYLSTKSEFFFGIQQLFGKDYGSFDYVFRDVTEGVGFRETKGLDQDLFIFLKDETDEMKKATLLFYALIEEMNKLCLNNDGRFIIVNLPTKIQFDKTSLSDDNIFDQLKIQKMLKEVTSKYNITFIDLYPVINNSKNPLGYYIEGEYHLDEEGHKVLCEGLYNFLTSKEFPGYQN